MIRIKKVTIITETDIPGEHLETFRHATAEHYGTHPDNVYLTYEDLSEKHEQNNNQ